MKKNEIQKRLAKGRLKTQETRALGPCQQNE